MAMSSGVPHMGYVYLNLLDSPGLLQILMTLTTVIKPLLPNFFYRYFKLRKAFSKFYCRHSALVEKYSVSLKTLLQRGISEPEFLGGLLYRFIIQIVGKSNFSEQFRKLINRYKRIGYSLDIMRQAACLVVNPIIVDGYASLFNCTGTRQFIDKTSHRHGFWRQFIDTIEDNSSTLFEDNSSTHYYLAIIPKLIK